MTDAARATQQVQTGLVNKGLVCADLDGTVSIVEERLSDGSLVYDLRVTDGSSTVDVPMQDYACALSVFNAFDGRKA